MAVEITNVGNVLDDGTLLLDGVYSTIAATVGGTQYLYTTSWVDDGVSVFSIASDGSLTNVFNLADTGPLELNATTGLDVIEIGGTQFLAVTGFVDDGVSIFTMNADGSLTFADDIADTSGRELNGPHMFDHIELGGTTYLYVAGSDDNGIQILSVDAMGNITDEGRVQDNGTLELLGVADVHIANVGGTNYLFAGGFDDDGLSVFEIGAMGGLTGVFNIADNGSRELLSPHSLITQEIGGTTFLFVAGFDDNGIQVFSVNNDGSLTEAFSIDDSSDPDLFMTQPAHLDITEVDGEFYLFVAGSGTAEIPNEDSADDGLQVFQISNTGALTLVDSEADSGSVELNRAYHNLVVDVDGVPFLYVSARSDDGISIFRIGEAPVTFTATGPFSIPEDIPNTSVVGDIDANELGGMADDNIVYAIVGGNDNIDMDGDAPFVIDSSTGIITVNDTDDIDFETQDQFDLMVSAQGLGEGVTITTTVTVNVTDVIDEQIMFVDTGPFDVDEDAANTTVVGNINATLDGDGNDVGILYSISGGNIDEDADTNPPFTIDPNTGVITVNDTDDIDFETLDEYMLTVVAVADGVPGLTNSTTVTITVNDALDEQIMFVDTGPFMVAEDDPDTTAVGDVNATVDGGANDENITYSIVGGNTNNDADGNLPFAIDPATGEITINDADDIDFETQTSFDLQVMATTGNPALDATATVTVTVTDVIDQDFMFTATGPFMVSEDAMAATAVGDVDATVDGDPADQNITYSITAGNINSDADGNLPFTIDPATGEITVNDPDDIDFETLDEYTLTVLAEVAGNPGLNDTAQVTINVTNVVDEDLMFQATGPFMVSEDAPNTTAVGDIDATVDGGATDDGITYSITGGNTDSDSDTNPPFTIDPATGAITVNDADDIDFENLEEYTLTVLAAVDGNMALNQSVMVTINVIDVIDSAPMFVDTGPFMVAENAPGATVVGDVNATVDGGANDQDLVYTITGGNLNGDMDAFASFAIDPNTGVITVNDTGDLDFETDPIYSLIVRAAVDGDAANFTEATVTVNLTNVVDEDLVFTDTGPYSVSEDAPNATSVGNVDANVDGGATDDGITYSITAGNTNGDGDGNLPFTINAATGEILVNDADDIDFETLDQYMLTILAEVDGNPALNDTTIVTVNVTDVIDEQIEFDAAGPFDILENSPTFTAVGDVDANLDGNPADQGITYSITAGNTSVDGDGLPAFQIDEDTGEIEVLDAQDLDFEQQNQFMLTILAEADGNPSLNNTTVVTINVLDDNDPPVITVPGTFNTDDGAPVALNGVAVDDEDGDTVTVTLTRTEDDGDFGGTLPMSVTVMGLGTNSVSLEGSTADVTAALAQLTYTPDLGETGTHSLDVTANDGNGGTDTATVTINLSDGAPDFDPSTTGPFSVPENSAVTTAVGDVDASIGGGTADIGVSYAITGGNDSIDGDLIGAFQINAATGEITVADMGDLDFEQQDTFMLTVQAINDVTSDISTVSVEINVTDVNEDPTVIVPMGLSTLEDTGVALAGFDLEDPDSDTLSITLTLVGATFALPAPQAGVTTTGDGMGSLTLEGLADDLDAALANLVFTPPLDFTGNALIDVLVDDSNGGTATATVTVGVGDEVFNFTNAGPFSLPENSPEGTDVGDIDTTLNGGDADDGLTYAIIDGNDSKDGDADVPFAIDTDTGELSVNDVGDIDFELMPTYVLTIQATNPETGNTSTSTVTINLTDINENTPPTVDAPTLATVEGSPVLLSGFNIEDIDGDDVTVKFTASNGIFTGTAGPGVMVTGLGTNMIELSGATDDLDTALGSIAFTPDDEFTGTETITYMASDPNEGVVMDSFAITVAEFEDADARDDMFTTVINTQLVGDVSLDNGDGADNMGMTDGFMFTLVEGPMNGDLILQTDGTFSYDPTRQVFCKDTFTYRISDGSGENTDTATVTIDIVFPEPEFPPFPSESEEFDTTTVGTASRDKLDRDDTNDYAEGLGGDDKLKAGGGDDAVDGGDGDDILKGDDGDDILFGGLGEDDIEGATGDDIIFGDAGNDVLVGGEGDDTIFGGDDDDDIKAGAGDDIIDGGDGDDRIYGRDGDDAITGGDGDDKITAGNGNDRIKGGAGFDEIRGGGDSDIFVFEMGSDTDLIVDFDTDLDQIDLSCSDFDVDNFEALLETVERDGRDLIFDFGNGDVLILNHVNAGDLSADNFIF